MTTQPATDRAFLAVILHLRGLDMPALARSIPRHLEGDGISEKSAEILLRSGMRSLLSCILRDRQPAALPGEAWPDAASRERIREATTASWRSGLRALREWADAQRPLTALPGADGALAAQPLH
ncbi:MAG TPA: hypothetical protein VNT60_07095 [Deinococcales bacterium]|nr:hypothetical protein [Deinococcales bacterium]